MSVTIGETLKQRRKETAQSFGKWHSATCSEFTAGPEMLGSCD